MGCDAIVIIATVGNSTLVRAVQSVLSQDYEKVQCLVVVDGPEYECKALEVLGDLASHDSVDVLVLPQNTGKNGYVCHRIYAALPLLVNQEFILYLDDDNWFDINHISSLVELCEREGADWAYSFRSICDESGKLICLDECESLGVWPVWYNPSVHHVDTNCYCLRRRVAVAASREWHKSRYGDKGEVLPSADTLVCMWLLQNFPNVRPSCRFSVSYVLGSWGLSPKPEFFLKGNGVYRARYPEDLPWKKFRGVSG